MSKRVITRRVVRTVAPAGDRVVEQKITVSRSARSVLRTPVTLAEAVGSPAVVLPQKAGNKKRDAQVVRVKRSA